VEIDPMDVATPETRDTSHSAATSRLSSLVAITVALLATFLGVCRVKDDNIVQAMEQAQADKLDTWAFYQSRNIREEVGRAALTELKLAETGAAAANREAYLRAESDYEQLVADQEKKKGDLQQQAEEDQRTYDALNHRDDQFDLADALGALAVSMLAITALTHKRWMYFAALVPALLSVAMGLAGLAGWHLHPDTLAKLLS
jgi:hypothetical protein